MSELLDIYDHRYGDLLQEVLKRGPMDAYESYCIYCFKTVDFDAHFSDCLWIRIKELLDE